MDDAHRYSTLSWSPRPGGTGQERARVRGTTSMLTDILESTCAECTYVCAFERAPARAYVPFCLLSRMDSSVCACMWGEEGRGGQSCQASLFSAVTSCRDLNRQSWVVEKQMWKATFFS